ncbi:MAG: hypothetical protein FJ202_05565 [Gemmatimonadetes bacterium]|nr:hypothetical protein [Gemmatimonadota bacterium]
MPLRTSPVTRSAGRGLLIGGILGAAVLAQPATGQSAVGGIKVRVSLPAYRQPVALDTMLFVTEHEVPAGKVWSAAERVFYDYKIATDKRDSVEGVIGTTRYVKSTYFQKFPMSQVFNCGMSITGPNADNFRLSIAMVAIVSPVSSTKSRLGIGMVGSGLDMRGSSTNPVVCATTGRAEADFADRVKKILATP